MSGLYSHTTRSTGTVLTASIYNSDHENHITNHVPEQMDDYSVDVAEMQKTTDPGGVGSENLATSVAGELERIRFMVAAIIGKTQWYESPILSLDTDGNIWDYAYEIDFKTADFTLSASEKGKQLDCEKASDLTVTVPANSTTSLAVGYSVTLVQAGAGQIVISPASGVTVQSNGSLKSAGQWAALTLHKRATDEWVLTGERE